MTDHGAARESKEGRERKGERERGERACVGSFGMFGSRGLVSEKVSWGEWQSVVSEQKRG